MKGGLSYPLLLQLDSLVEDDLFVHMQDCTMSIYFNFDRIALKQVYLRLDIG